MNHICGQKCLSCQKLYQASSLDSRAPGFNNNELNLPKQTSLMAVQEKNLVLIFEGSTLHLCYSNNLLHLCLFVSCVLMHISNAPSLSSSTAYKHKLSQNKSVFCERHIVKLVISERTTGSLSRAECKELRRRASAQLSGQPGFSDILETFQQFGGSSFFTASAQLDGDALSVGSYPLSLWPHDIKPWDWPRSGEVGTDKLANLEATTDWHSDSQA